MNYALVIKALQRHVGIAQRSVDFFRQQRMGWQFTEGVAVLEEATRALAEVQKMKDMHDFQVDLWKQGMIKEPPNPVPPDTTQEDLPPSSADFADKKLSCKHENMTIGEPVGDGSGQHYAVCADCGKRM